MRYLRMAYIRIPHAGLTNKSSHRSAHIPTFFLHRLLQDEEYVTDCRKLPCQPPQRRFVLFRARRPLPDSPILPTHSGFSTTPSHRCAAPMDGFLLLCLLSILRLLHHMDWIQLTSSIKRLCLSRLALITS